jgi:hypothetical protein
MATRKGASDAIHASKPGLLRTLGRVVRGHPWLTAVLIGCSVLGAVIGALNLSADWSITRRAVGGAVAGAGVALIVTAARMLD